MGPRGLGRLLRRLAVKENRDVVLDVVSVAYVLGAYLSPLPSILATREYLPLYVVFIIVIPFMIAYRLWRRLKAYYSEVRRQYLASKKGKAEG